MGVDPRGFRWSSLARAAAALQRARSLPGPRRVLEALRGKGRVGGDGGAGTSTGLRGKGLGEQWASPTTTAAATAAAPAAAAASASAGASVDSSGSRGSNKRPRPSVSITAAGSVDGSSESSSAAAAGPGGDGDSDVEVTAVTKRPAAAAAALDPTAASTTTTTATLTAPAPAAAAAATALSGVTVGAVAAAVHAVAASATVISARKASAHAAALVEAAQSAVFGVNVNARLSQAEMKAIAAAAAAAGGEGGTTASLSPSSSSSSTAAADVSATKTGSAVSSKPSSSSSSSSTVAGDTQGGALVDVFTAELTARLRVLTRLGHIDAKGMLTPLGRFASGVEAVDELVLAALVFDNSFASYSPAEIAGLLTCLFEADRTSGDRTPLPPALAPAIARLHAIVEEIADVSNDCGQRVDKAAYLAGFRHGMAPVAHAWASGEAFAEVANKTDAHAGSIVRLLRRLAELLKALVASAQDIGNEALTAKFEAAEKAVRRGLPFASSLYTD